MGISLAKFIQSAQVALPECTSFLSGITTWDNLFNAIKYESRIISDPHYRDPLLTRVELIQRKAWLDGLYSAGLSLRSERRARNTMQKWEQWNYCPFCWRITSGKRWGARCSIHRVATCGPTQKARRLLKRISYISGPEIKLTDYQIEKWNLKQEALIIPSYWDAWPKDVDYFDDNDNMMNHPTRITRFSYPMDKVWNVFNHTGQYAFENGANLNSLLSVIKTIDDQGDPHRVRDNLHLSFSRDIRRAKVMLIRCESWLRLMSKKRRGDRRKGKGGKRTGAGRPPKDTH